MARVPTAKVVSRSSQGQIAKIYPKHVIVVFLTVIDSKYILNEQVVMMFNLFNNKLLLHLEVTSP